MERLKKGTKLGSSSSPLPSAGDPGSPASTAHVFQGTCCRGLIPLVSITPINTAISALVFLCKSQSNHCNSLKT